MRPMEHCNGDYSAVSPDEQRAIPRVDVVFLTYNSKSHQPSISLDSVSTVSLYELKKHRHAKKNQKTEMSMDAYKHYQWYNSVLSNQLREDGGPMLLKTFHWYIETSNVDAFDVEGAMFEAVSLIIGSEVEHWYYAKAGRSMCGSRVRLRNCKWEMDFAAQAKARISDCLVASPNNRPSPPSTTVGKQRRSCSKRLSLGTISEE